MSRGRIALVAALFAADWAWGGRPLAAALKLPVSKEHAGLGTGEVDANLTWIGTRRLTEKLAADVNVGYTLTGDRHDEAISDLILYGVALRYRMTEALEPVVEVFGTSPVGPAEPSRVLVNGGLRWYVKKNLALDAAIGTGLTEDAPDLIATAGLTWEL